RGPRRRAGNIRGTSVVEISVINRGGPHAEAHPSRLPARGLPRPQRRHRFPHQLHPHLRAHRDLGGRPRVPGDRRRGLRGLAPAVDRAQGRGRLRRPRGALPPPLRGQGRHAAPHPGLTSPRSSDPRLARRRALLLSQPSAEASRGASRSAPTRTRCRWGCPPHACPSSKYRRRSSVTGGTSYGVPPLRIDSAPYTPVATASRAATAETSVTPPWRTKSRNSAIRLGSAPPCPPSARAITSTASGRPGPERRDSQMWIWWPLPSPMFSIRPASPITV